MALRMGLTVLAIVFSSQATVLAVAPVSQTQRESCCRERCGTGIRLPECGCCQAVQPITGPPRPEERFALEGPFVPQTAIGSEPPAHRGSTSTRDGNQDRPGQLFLRLCVLLR